MISDKYYIDKTVYGSTIGDLRLGFRAMIYGWTLVKRHQFIAFCICWVKHQNDSKVECKLNWPFSGLTLGLRGDISFFFCYHINFQSIVSSVYQNQSKANSVKYFSELSLSNFFRCYVCIEWKRKTRNEHVTGYFSLNALLKFFEKRSFINYLYKIIKPNAVFLMIF